MNKNTEKLQKLFVKMCEEVTFDNEFYFDINQVECDDKYSEVRNDENYMFLLEKMNNLIVLLNKNPKLFNSDIETELWYMI
jgi:hypothetical protein